MGLENAESPEKPEKADIHVDLGFEFLALLNELATTYYGGNRTQALRRGIQRLESWHDDEVEQQWSEDEIKHHLSENRELLESLRMRLESIEEELEKSNQESSLPSASPDQVSEDVKDELYRELTDADRWLSADQLIARTNLELVDLSMALGELIDESLVESQREDQKVVYGVAGTTHNSAT